VVEKRIEERKIGGKERSDGGEGAIPVNICDPYM